MSEGRRLRTGPEEDRKCGNYCIQHMEASTTARAGEANPGERMQFRAKEH